MGKSNQGALCIGGRVLDSRLFVGTGKYGSHEEMRRVVAASKAEVITMAVRRIHLEQPEENLLHYLPETMQLLPNTSGARNADEAVRIARLAKAMGCGNWVKIEIMRDAKYLLPDNYETVRATERLANEGFVVLPYMHPDLTTAQDLVSAGAATVMPLAAPIGSNQGLQTKALIQLLIDNIDLPIIVDAGIGRPSEAAELLEMGADGVLVNTAIASSEQPEKMAMAFANAVAAGRAAFEAGLGPRAGEARASSPLLGFLR